MIDHLLRFETEIDMNAFQIELPEDATLGNNATGAMVGDMPVTLLKVSITIAYAVCNPDTGEEITPAAIAEGAWLVVRSDNEIDWRSDTRLVAVTNHELANTEEPFVLYKNDNFPWEAMQGRVSPTFAGSNYPFGSHMNETQLIVEEVQS